MKKPRLPPKEFILDALRGRSRPSGALALADVDRELADAARRSFGSLERALEAAGVAIRKGPAPAVAVELGAFVAAFVDEAVELARRQALADLATGLGGARPDKRRERRRNRQKSARRGTRTPTVLPTSTSS